MNMQKNKTIAVISTIVTLFILYSTTQAQAPLPISGLFVNPGTITTPGGSTAILLITPTRAIGTLTVKCLASGNEWSTSIDTGLIGMQSWTFPDDFPGADTNTLGMYYVSAEITMMVGKYTWRTTFRVEFFVIPDLPFGTIMAVVALFGAVIGYTKIKRNTVLH